MKNTNSITKYVLALQVALLAVVFLVSAPTITSAQSSSSGGGYDSYSSEGDYDTYSYEGDYDTYSYEDDYDTYSYEDDYYYPTSYVSNGGFYGGYSSYVPRYYYNGDSTVTTGGFSGGTLNVVAPTTYYTNPYVVSGGFMGGTVNNTYSDSQLTGSCFASVNNNQTVTWSASATGGNNFYTYFWTGDEGLSGNSASVTRSYSFGGTKTANVTITSNGQSVTRTCSTSLNQVVQNQVLAYSDTATPLSGVYLSDVPYTGAGDVARVIAFISGLILWSILLAYMFLKRKYNLQNVFATITNTETPKADLEISNTLSGNMTSDTKDITFVEEYARLKKVILSTEASVRLVKLQRLGTASAIEIIDKLAGSEWTAVGESDIETHL